MFRFIVNRLCDNAGNICTIARGEYLLKRKKITKEIKGKNDS